MSEDVTQRPVECTATEAERAARSTRLPSVLGERFRGATERDDGYTLAFDGSEAALAGLATFVAEERECCSFADYRIELSPPYDETRLLLSGPDGTKEQFEALVDLLASTADGDDTVPATADGRDVVDPDEPPGDADRRRAIRDHYGEIATRPDSGRCCGSGASEPPDGDGDAESLKGYDESDFERAPGSANLGLGCGNPTAIAGLEPGETVLDLGAGAGFDCFLADGAVGADGRVIGVDMTPEMVERARENAAERDASNVEFRLGEIEHLPVADDAVDVILSNCVLNLSPDKPRAFREAHRVLRPGGRLAVSDVVLTAELPAELATDPAAIAGCVGDAAPVDDLEAMLREAGFTDVAVEPEAESEAFVREWDDERDPSDYVAAATIEARKADR